MKLAALINAPGRFKEGVEQARAAGDLEAAGADLIWVGEAAGFDSPSILGYLAATTDTCRIGAGILNPFTRSPALIAMTGLTLGEITGGRFTLGLGLGPKALIEGLHGIPHEGAIRRIDEIIGFCRAAWAGEAVGGGLLSENGQAARFPPFPLPTGAAKHPIPIHVAGQGERVVELAAARADGWAPMLLFPERFHEVFGESLERGRQRRDSALGPLEISAGGVLVAVSEDEEEVAAARQKARATLALYTGGLGGRGRNVYNKLMRRYGYTDAAKQVEELFLSGRRDEAAAALPDDFVDGLTLIGSPGQVRTRIQAFARAGVTSLTIEPIGDPVRTMASLRALALHPVPDAD